MTPSSANPTQPDWLPALRRALPRGKALFHPTQCLAYASDALGYKRFIPDGVIIPADTEELKQVVAALQQIKLPYQIRGAGTSLSGGPVAAEGGIIIHTSRLRSIQKIDTDNRYAVVEAGAILDDLNHALESHSLYYPPDPSSGPVCTIGGNVASNSGGAHCFRYGVTGNYVLGVEAILMDGSCVQFGGPAGGRGPWREDWKRLMVGSEGTLATFTRFWLRLIAKPEKAWTFRAMFPDIESVSRAIQRLATDVSFPTALELMDPRSVELIENSPMAVGLPKGFFMLLTEIDGPPALVDLRSSRIIKALQDCGASNLEYSDDPAKRKALWRARKVAGGLLGQVSPDFMVQDAVIPKKGLNEMLNLLYRESEKEGLACTVVMHAGDGNLHPNFLFDSRDDQQMAALERLSHRFIEAVSAMDGTLSGEHGIGNDKAAYTAAHFGPHAAAFQMAVPATFNPSHQMNPRKVFPERRYR